MKDVKFILVFAYGERELGEAQGVVDEKTAKAYFDAEVLAWSETQRPIAIKKVTTQVIREQKDVKIPDDTAAASTTEGEKV